MELCYLWQMGAESPFFFSQSPSSTHSAQACWYAPSLYGACEPHGIADRNYGVSWGWQSLNAGYEYNDGYAMIEVRPEGYMVWAVRIYHV